MEGLEEIQALLRSKECVLDEVRITLQRCAEETAGAESQAKATGAAVGEKRKTGDAGTTAGAESQAEATGAVDGEWSEERRRLEQAVVRRQTPFPGIEQILTLYGTMESRGFGAGQSEMAMAEAAEEWHDGQAESATEGQCHPDADETGEVQRCTWSMKVTPGFLAQVGMSEAELWEAAARNTFTAAEFRIRPMWQLLEEILGGADWCDGTFGAMAEMTGMEMYVLSNARQYRGAVQVLNEAALSAWAQEQGVRRLVMLPSSLHEVILLPADDMEPDLDMMNAMVREINMTQVAPRDRLSDRAYLLTAPYWPR
ncbi:MAG: hypothetical protein IJT34_09495 [Butyrivibrio sp.]|nr:hypothetical protein [Butyrivibrio sp.]